MSTSSSLSNLPVGMLKDLKPSTKPPSLKVLVLHSWDVIVANANTREFIIMDTNGDKFHGSMPRRLVPTYERYMQQDNVICLADYKVIEKRKKYFSPLPNQYDIEFTDNTKVEDIEEELLFPPIRFRFTSYAELRNKLDKINYLSDVIGMFEQIDDSKQISPRSTIREMYLRNEKQETVKITFWNESMNMIPPTLINNGTTPIVIVTSVRVTQYNGKITVSTTMGTKIYVDLNTPQVSDLKKLITTPSPGAPQKRLLTSESHRTTKDIRAAVERGQTGFHLCRASIQQVYEDEGWMYPACPRCRKKVVLKEEGYKCSECTDWIEEPIHRYKLQIQICDKFGLLEVTLFDESVTELTGISLEDMKNINEKPITGETEVHQHLTSIIGKECNFRIKIQPFNLQKPQSSLTVSSVTPIEQQPNKKHHPELQTTISAPRIERSDSQGSTSHAGLGCKSATTFGYYQGL